MSDKPEAASIVDLAEARRSRVHEIHEARLQEVRSAFEKAFPIPSAKSKRSKKNKPRKR